MREEIKPPAACATMPEVRAGVDALDGQILGLLAKRFRYMDAAARIKTERSTVRNEVRKAEVLARVRASAEELGVPPAAAVQLYEQLIESSIAYELEQWDALRSRDGAAVAR